MRIIMVPVADRPECANALDTAFELAARLNANVAACHIRPHRYSEVMMPAETGLLLRLSELPELSEKDRKKAESASVAAKKLVEKIAKTRGFSVAKFIRGDTERALLWQESVGHVQKLIPIIGPFADLIVVTRPQRKQSKIARLFLTQSLLHTSRPLLMVPPRKPVHVGKRIVIGWDRTHGALRAVVAALPLLGRAEHVSIITSGTGKVDGPKAGRLINYLRAWGIDAKASRTRGTRTDAVADLLGHYKEVSADLLVIGSYSRSRFRERVFGGVTEHFLGSTSVPVLTIHND